MAYLELSERDRKRYDLPERVEFEPGQVGMRAIRALRKETGYEFDTLARLVQGVPKMVDGEPVLEPWPDDDGNEVLNPDGTVRQQVALVHDEEALAAMVWVILWDNGHRLPWDTFDVYPLGLRMVAEDDEGKAPTTETESSTTTES